MEYNEPKRIVIYCAVVAVLIAAIVAWWRWDNRQIPPEPDLPGEFFAAKVFTYKADWEPGSPIVPFPAGALFFTEPAVVAMGEARRDGAGFVVTPTYVVKADIKLPPNWKLNAPPQGPLPDEDVIPVLVRWSGDGAPEAYVLNPSLANSAYFYKRQLAADPLKHTRLNLLLLEHRWDKNSGRDVVVGLFNEVVSPHLGKHVEIIVTEDSALDDAITGLPVVSTRFRDEKEQRAVSCPSYGAWRLLRLLEQATGVPEGDAARRVEGEVIVQRLNWMRAAIASCAALPNDEDQAYRRYVLDRAERLKAATVSPYEVQREREGRLTAVPGAIAAPNP